MNCTITEFRRVAIVACGLWFAWSALAQGTFVMPSGAATTYGNSQPEPFMPGPGAIYPFRYQEVFSSSDMVMPFGVHYITAVSFRLAAFGQSSVDAVLPEIEIRLSTTPRSVNLLSTTYANNVGPDETVVHARGPLAISATYVPGGVVQPFDVLIEFETPFLYDRSWGNLLLDVINYGGSGRRVGFDYKDSEGDSVSSVGLADLEHGGEGTSGLVAEFTFADVPEPFVVYLLVVGGVPVLVGTASRCRKVG